MKLPSKANGMTIFYGIYSEVYVETDGKTWSVWDTRPVRQGARHMSDHKTFDDAEAEALLLSRHPLLPESDSDG